jgi:hypothetical protein
MLPWWQPPSLAMISEVQDRLVDVDDSKTLLKGIKIASSCHLPLQLSWRRIMNGCDGLHHPIRRLHYLPQVMTYKASAHSQLAFFQKQTLQMLESHWTLRIIKMQLDNLSRSVMKLPKAD